MERRGCGLGCIIAALGIALSCCLLPYLASSIYSIVNAIFQVPTAPRWLWGDWINTVVEGNRALYMLLAEGPICCVGTLALLIVVLGVVVMVSGLGQGGEEYAEERYESDQE